MHQPKMAVIVNVTSGKKDEGILLQEIRSACARFSLAPKLFLVHPGTEVASVARKALTENIEILVAAGGDGTVSRVAGELVGKNIALGVIPVGTLNHFAKDLSLPLTINEAVAVLAHGKTALVDIASVNGRFFLNNSSIGLYPKALKHRAELERQGLPKWFALLVILRRLFRWRFFLQVRITSKERVIQTKTPFVFIGNNEYILEGMEIGSRSRLDGGALSVSVVHGDNRFHFLWFAFAALRGKLRNAEALEVFQTKSATIETKKKFLEVACDGETVALPTPLRYTLHPRSLTVCITK